MERTKHLKVFVSTWAPWRTTKDDCRIMPGIWGKIIWESLDTIYLKMDLLNIGTCGIYYTIIYTHAYYMHTISCIYTCTFLYYFSPLGGIFPPCVHEKHPIHVRPKRVNNGSHWYIWGALAILRTSQHEKVTGRSHWVFSGQALRSSELRHCGLQSSKGHISFQWFDTNPSTRVPLGWNQIKAEQKTSLWNVKCFAIQHLLGNNGQELYLWWQIAMSFGFFMLYKFLLAIYMCTMVQSFKRQQTRTHRISCAAAL